MMIHILAQAAAAATAGSSSSSETTPEKMAAWGFAIAVIGFLCLYFKADLARIKKRVGKLEAVATANIQFTSSVTAASQAGPTVDSKLIHRLYDQHRPPDFSGEFRPLQFEDQK